MTGFRNGIWPMNLSHAFVIYQRFSLIAPDTVPVTLALRFRPVRRTYGTDICFVEAHTMKRTTQTLTIPAKHSVLAPRNYCINGGRSELCKRPRCVFTQFQFANWNDSEAPEFQHWFNQYVRSCAIIWVMSLFRSKLYIDACMHIQFLENVMLRRWMTSKWNSPYPIVIVPSPYIQCIKR